MGTICLAGVEAIVVITMVAIVFGLIQVSESFLRRRRASSETPSFFSQTRVDDRNNQDLKTVPVYLSIFVLGVIFEFGIALDAARLKNTIQVSPTVRIVPSRSIPSHAPSLFQCIGVAVFNVALIITAALEISQVRDALTIQDQDFGGIPCRDDPSRVRAERT